MGTSGIQKGLVKDTKGNIKNYQNGVIVELKQYSASFTAYIDETCIGRNTANPKTTIEKVKWFLIREHVWYNFKALYPKLTHQEFFERLKQEYSGFTIVEGNNSVITSEMVTKGSEDGELGATYLLMPYSVYPEYEGVANIRTVILGTPRILYCHFKFPKGGYIPLENSDKKAAYGQTVDVEIYTHLLPDWRNNAEKFNFEVELINKGEAVAKSKIIEIRNLGNFSYNGRSKIQFLIEPKWQKEHKDKKGNEEYYLKLKGKLGSSHIAKVSQDNETHDIEYDSQNAKVDWMRMEKGKWVYDTSRMLLVPYDTLADMMSRFEIEKTNMIQYIGDIRYTQKEYDPCGYSKITIKDEDDKERDALVIFDEDDTKNPIDRTSQIFKIIAGDERKNISITVDKLTTKGVLCRGLLLESGQKHNEQKNVFQLDRVMPALRRKDGLYLVEQDPENKDDLDVMPDKNRGLSKDVSDVQQWQFGTDYKFDGENKMLLMPKYVFNKTALENIQIYSSSSIGNEALNSLWLFNYFILNDDLAQTYFVPISTCRYPNQIAKIKVYPDIEWEIAFLITIGAGYSGSIKYERQRLNSIHRGYNFRYLKDDLQIGVTQSSNLGWSIMGKCAINGKEHSLGFEGIKKSVDLLVSTFNASREILEVLNPDGTNPADSAAVSKKIIQIDFAIDPPNIGFALSKKFGEASNKEIVPVYKGGFRADPFIGITISVDLVPLVTKIPYVGIVIDWIIKVIEYLTDSDVYITFEAGLAVKFDFTLSYNRIDGLDGKEGAQQVITVEVPISIKAGCKSNDVIMIPTVTRGGITETTEMEKWKVEGKLSTTFTFTKTYGYDKDKGKQYEQSKGVWNPAEITITCYELTTSKITGSPVKSDKFKLFDEKTLFDNPKTYTDEQK